MTIQSVIPTSGSKMFYTSGSAFTKVEIPGVSSWNVSGGDPDTRQNTTFQGTRQTTGSPQAPTIDITFGAYNPQHPVIRSIMDDFSGARQATFTATTTETVVRSLVADDGVSGITAPGVMTFQGTSAKIFDNNDFGQGFVVRLGNSLYVIESILTDATCQVKLLNSSKDGFDTITAVSSAAAADIIVPGLEWNLGSCSVGSPTVDFPSDGDLSGGIRLFPSKVLSSTDWKLTTSTS